MPLWAIELLQYLAISAGLIVLLNLALCAYLITDYRKYLKHQEKQQNL